MRRVAICEPLPAFQAMPDTTRVGHDEQEEAAGKKPLDEAVDGGARMGEVLEGVQRDDHVEAARRERLPLLEHDGVGRSQPTGAACLCRRIVPVGLEVAR